MDHSRIQLVVAAGCLLAAGLAAAGDRVGAGYIAPSAAYVDDDEDRLVEDGVSGGQLNVGYAFHEFWNIEAFAGAASMDGFPDQDQFEIGANLLAVFNREGLFSPYLLGGISNLNTEFPTGSDDNLGAGSLGAGFFLDFGESRVSLRAEYRFRSELGGTEFDDQLVNLGLQFGFGGSPRIADADGDGVADGVDRCPNTPIGVQVDPRGCELDGDGDGVPDSRDRCPDTPAGARVDANGCEIQTDSDGDGVPDGRDRCPNTPAGARVNASGCELDDDGDGVVNSRDRCPNTAAGVRVDVNGCEIREVIELPGVTFETNSDRLLPGAEDVLDNAAATLRKHPDLVVEVAGHTDSDGSAAYNQGLSERRAKSVRNYLVDRGANAANLSVKGYGESQPVADNSTAAGKARNRRVELRILSR